MRRFLFSPHLHRGGEVSEVLWSAVIAFVAYIMAYLIIALAQKTGFSLRGSVDAATIAVIAVSLIVFMRLRFRALHALLIGMGAAFMMRSAYGVDDVTLALEAAFGLWMIIRFFSVGPTRV